MPPVLIPAGAATPGAPAFRRVLATGGIGHGIFFALEGDATLGRNESRLAQLQPGRDYCKLHIITHYIAVLLGAGRNLEIIPIGRVGDDPQGARLREEMSSVGMSLDEVRQVPGSPTLYSVCFLYPDKSGGNITTASSASSTLTPADMDAALLRHPPGPGRDLVLAVPEVPLEARARLLSQGRARGAFTAASVLSSEARAFAALGGLECTDLLSVNREEACAVAGIQRHDLPAADVAAAAAETLSRANPAALLVVTDGRHGSWACAGGRTRFSPGLPVTAVATGGAGDALLAGVLCGLCCGLPFIPDESSDSGPAFAGAVDLGTAVAAMSVESPHSIHPDIDAASLLGFIQRQGGVLSPGFRAIFAGAHDTTT